MRAVTRTTLSLGDLLEIPIGICAATGSSDPKFEAGIRPGTEPESVEDHPDAAFDAIEAAELEALAPEDAEPAREAVYIKGVKVGGDLHEVPGSEFEWAAAVSKLDRVEVLEFCDYRRVPTDRLAGSFWVQPDPAFDRPLATLMSAMRQMHRAMVVKFNLKSRQRLGVIRVRKVGPKDTDLAFLLNAVVYSAEWRKPDARVLAPANALGEVDPRAVEHAVELISDMLGDGSSLDGATDRLVDEHTRIAEHAIEGLYDSPAGVLTVAGKARDEGHPERAYRLVEYVADRWPEVVEAAMRERAEAIIAEGGEDVGGKLAALVG